MLLKPGSRLICLHVLLLRDKEKVSFYYLYRNGHHAIFFVQY